jgi:hypothetical protein
MIPATVARDSSLSYSEQLDDIPLCIEQPMQDTPLFLAQTYMTLLSDVRNH